MPGPDLEIEVTYLAMALPPQLTSYPSTRIDDHYIPAESRHPQIRLRSKDGQYTLTKKQPVHEGDSRIQHEYNTPLSAVEYRALREVPGKAVSKIRYRVPFEAYTAEVDVFQDDLAGLVIVELEFPSAEAMAATAKPPYAGADISNEEFVAGGMLAGKTLAEIQPVLDRLGYQPLH